MIWPTRRTPGPGQDAQFDAWLAQTWEEGAATVAGTLDLTTGKAALLTARGRRESAGWPAGQGTTLSLACAAIDTLLAGVTRELNQAEPGPAHAAAVVPLAACHQSLLQLRAGLTGRTMAKARALQMVTSIGHALAEASHMLHALPPAISGPAASETQQLTEQLAGLQQQLPGLAHTIERLFDDADDLHPRIPVPSR